MKRKHIVGVLVVFLICYLSLAVYAHPGRTDSQGGHYDQGTGEYHYHHGYPAHDHYDMDGDGILDCPYDFEDRTGDNSGSTSDGSINRHYDVDGDGIIDYLYDEDQIQGNTSGSGDSGGNGAATAGKQKGGNTVWWILYIVVAVAIVALVLSNYYSKKESQRLRLELLEASNELKEKQNHIKLMKDIFEKDTLRMSDELNSYKDQYNKILEILPRISDICQIASIGGYSIDNPIPEETLSKLQLNLQIPKGIYFDNEMYPVCLNYSKNKPYGDFTVYSGENSKVYHNDISCSGNPGKLMHLFDAINAGKRPCKRCVQCTNLPSTIPQWYIDIKKIQEFQLGKP